MITPYKDIRTAVTNAAAAADRIADPAGWVPVDKCIVAAR